MIKLFFILLFVLLVGGSIAAYFFYFGPEPESVTSPLQPTATPIPNTPTQVPLLEQETKQIRAVLEQFYTAYGDCMKSPPLAAKGRVGTYCQANTGVTTESFVENLRQSGTARAGGDPITCAQTMPTSVTGDAVDFESPERVVALALAQYGTGFAQKIPVILVKESREWRVENVTCPRA